MKWVSCLGFSAFAESWAQHSKLASVPQAAGGFFSPKLVRGALPPLHIPGVLAREAIEEHEVVCRIWPVKMFAPGFMGSALVVLASIAKNVPRRQPMPQKGHWKGGCIGETAIRHSRCSNRTLTTSMLCLCLLHLLLWLYCYWFVIAPSIIQATSWIKKSNSQYCRGWNTCFSEY